MTAPRWIAEAFDVMMAGPGVGDPEVEKLASALIERLPLEAMITAAATGPETDPDIPIPLRLVAARRFVSAAMNVLTDGDPEVVELVELYQGACRVLDGAGVPHALNDAGQLPVRLNLAGRISWLSEQRPIRAELDSAQATRKLAEDAATKYMAERDAARSQAHTLGEFIRAAHEELTIAGVPNSPTDSQHMLDSALARRVRALRDERDHLQKMYEGASDDLDRERSANQEASGAAANREIALTVELETARAELERERGGHRAVDAVLEVRDARVTALEDVIRSLVESDLPAGQLRSALAALIGDETAAIRSAVAATDRQVLRAKIADQAAYIEQLEAEIDALEDEIWEDAP